MEVLGTVASTVALVEVSLKVLSLVRELSDLQSDFLELKDQITTISLLIKAFRKIPNPFSNIAGVPQVSEPEAVDLAARQLLNIKDELDKIVAYCAQAPNDKQSRAKKHKWFLQRSKITKLHKKALDAKLNLQLAIQIQSDCNTAAWRVEQNKFHSEVIPVIQSLRYMQLTSSLHIRSTSIAEGSASRIEEIETEESNPVTSTTATVVCRDDVVRQSTSQDPSTECVVTRQPLASREERHLQVSTTQVTSQSARIQGCRCACHFSQRRFQGPTWLRPLLGSWRIDYTPASDGSRTLCSEPTCECSGETQVNMEYQLPLWLWTRTMLFKAAASSSCGLSFAIRPVRVLATNDFVWTWMEQSSLSSLNGSTPTLTYFPRDHDSSGRGLIDYAIDIGGFDVIELLLNQWQNLLLKQGLPLRTGYVARERLEFYTSQGSSREVELLHKVISFVEDMPDWQASRVHKAAYQGDGMGKALREDAWAIDELDSTGHAPLHHATMRNNIEAVEELIAAKADVNKPDFEGWTPLMYTARYNNLECMRLLIKAQCNINQINSSGDFAMHWAVKRCAKNAVTLLLAARASTSVRGWWGRTLLHSLAECRHDTDPDAIDETMQLLLLTKDVDLEARDNDGITPAMYALCGNNLPVLRCLIQAGASLHSVSANSWNLLHLAADFAGAELLQYLLSLDPKVFSGINHMLRSDNSGTPWSFFLYSASPWNLGAYRCPSPTEQDLFAALYETIRDQNLHHDISVLENVIECLHRDHVHDARAQLAILTDRKREWNEYDLVAWYRGLYQKIQDGELESVIVALTGDIEDCKAEIGTSPWGMENQGASSASPENNDDE